MRGTLVCVSTLFLVCATVDAQTPVTPATPASDVTARTIKAISYQIGSGDTEIARTVRDSRKDSGNWR